MFSKISVLVPTRQRVDRLQTMIDSFRRTSDGVAELVFRIDDDDVETRNFLVGHFGTPGAILIGPKLDGYRSMHAFFNDLLTIASGDVLMIGNDDMVFRTFGWPTMILEAANRYPDGLFDLGVSTHNETHFPFSVVSRIAVESMGFLWDPRLFWGDIFLRDVMAYFGRCEMLPHVKIDHEWAGHPYDVLHYDPDYWTATHPNAVNEAIAKLRSAA